MTETATGPAITSDQNFSSSTSRRSFRSIPVVPVAMLLVAASVAAIVYQPWVNTPLDILDFSDFLSILRGHDSFAQRLSGFIDHYAAQGRFNLLNYVFLAWKWSLFGLNESAWQIARSVQMITIVVGVYLLLRRLDAGRWGSAAGAALFVVAQTASPAWIRLPMGEPLGLLTALAAGLIATRYQETPRWRAAGAGMAALLTATVLTKELLIVLVPFVLTLACTRDAAGAFRRPQLTLRNVWVASLSAAGMLVVGVPVTIVALQAPSSAYSSDYGRGAFTVGHFLYSFLSIMLPAQGLFGGKVSLLQQVGNLLFLGVVCAGLVLAREDKSRRGNWRSVTIAAVALATAAALIYLPIPFFQDYFGLPFVLAPAILLAISVTAIERRRSAWGWVAYSACSLTLVQCALYAAHASRASIAARRIHLEVVRDFAAHPTSDSVVIMMPYIFNDHWRRRGPTLDRYGRAILPRRRLPAHFDDVPCSLMPTEIRRAAGNTIAVSYASGCGMLEPPDRVLRQDYRYISWPSLTIRPDSIVISIVGPKISKTH